MTTQDKVKELVTVNGIPAAEGLVELAMAVMEYDAAARAYGYRHTKKNRQAADKAHSAMLAKAQVVIGDYRLGRVLKIGLDKKCTVG